MRFVTNDGRFGIDLEASEPNGFFLLWLVVNHCRIGDGTPAIVWTDLHSLRRVQSASDPRLDATNNSVLQILTVLTLPENRHLYVPVLGECFDRYFVRIYEYDGVVTILAIEDFKVDEPEAVVWTTTARNGYDDVVDAAIEYHQKCGR